MAPKERVDALRLACQEGTAQWLRIAKEQSRREAKDDIFVRSVLDVIRAEDRDRESWARPQTSSGAFLRRSTSRKSSTISLPSALEQTVPTFGEAERLKRGLRRSKDPLGDCLQIGMCYVGQESWQNAITFLGLASGNTPASVFKRKNKSEKDAEERLARKLLILDDRRRKEKIAALNRKREIEELKIRAREGQRRKAAYKELVRVNLILDNPREAADSIYCLRHLLPQAEERREINEWLHMTLNGWHPSFDKSLTADCVWRTESAGRVTDAHIEVLEELGGAEYASCLGKLLAEKRQFTASRRLFSCTHEPPIDPATIEYGSLQCIRLISNSLAAPAYDSTVVSEWQMGRLKDERLRRAHSDWSSFEGAHKGSKTSIMTVPRSGWIKKTGAMRNVSASRARRSENLSVLRGLQVKASSTTIP